MNIYLISVVVYLILMALIGVYFAKKSVHTGEDFIIAGRSLPLPVVIGTLLATFVGSGTVVGGASFIYQYGPFAAIFNLSGSFIGMIILYFIATKIRNTGMYTVPQMIEKRFGISARILSTILIILAYVGITAYQFTGGAYVLQLTTGIPLKAGTIIMVVLVIFLTATGGLFSVAYTDAISSILIVGGFLLGLPFALNAVGGFEGLSLSLPEHALSWNGGLSIIQLIGYFLPLFLLILGDQNMYQRLSASKSAAVAKKSTVGFVISNALVIGLTILLATTAIVMFPGIDADAAILKIAVDGVPTGIGIIILSAAVAFLITTGTSYLLSVSGNLVYDLFQRFSKNEISEKRILVLNRWTVVGLGVFAYILGEYFPTVLELQMYAYTMYGAAITPAIIATMLWKQATRYGIVSSMIVGGAATVIWELFLDKPFDWNSVIVSLPLAILALVIISLTTKDERALNHYISQ